MASKGRGIQVIIYDKQRRIPIPMLRQTILDPILSYRDFVMCSSFIRRQPTDKIAVLLITTTDDQHILEQFQALPTVDTILIFSTVNKPVEDYPNKVWGVYLHVDGLLRVLPDLLDTIEDRLNSHSFVFHHLSGIRDNPSFYFYPLWKNREEEKTKKKKTIAKRQFVREARLLFSSNHWLKGHIDEFELTYKAKEVLAWLDPMQHPFPYHRLLIYALRTHDESILNQARFFLNDLTAQFQPAGTVNTENHVYLGTKLSTASLDKFIHHRANDLIAFQCFLSTCASRVAALHEAQRVVSRRTDLMNVLFKIELNQCRCVRIGDRTIIDMATPFRIRYVTKNTERPIFHTIKLVALTEEEKDRLYRSYRERLERSQRKSQTPRKKETSTAIEDHEAIADQHVTQREYSLAIDRLHLIPEPSVRVLNKLGSIHREHFHNLLKALEYHEKALSIAIGKERFETLLHLGKVHQGLKDYDEALNCFLESLQWYETQEEQDWINIARCLVGIANAQRGRKHLDVALEAAERSLAIREYQIHPTNDFDVAASLGTIGNILHDQGDFYRGLVYAKKAVEILTRCGHGDPRLSAALNNLGAMYQSNGDVVKAKECFQKAIEALPSENHPHRESATVNLAQVMTLRQTENGD